MLHHPHLIGGFGSINELSPSYHAGFLSHKCTEINRETRNLADLVHGREPAGRCGECAHRDFVTPKKEGALWLNVKQRAANYNRNRYENMNEGSQIFTKGGRASPQISGFTSGVW